MSFPSISLPFFPKVYKVFFFDNPNRTMEVSSRQSADFVSTDLAAEDVGQLVAARLKILATLVHGVARILTWFK